MDVCGLPKARPISCNDCPAFQRRHTSVLCAAESPTRFPWLINTTFEEKIHIRWCCINLLRPHRLSDMRQMARSMPVHRHSGIGTITVFADGISYDLHQSLLVAKDRGCISDAV